MRVLIPTSYFLRVDDKFSAEEWLAEDQDLKSGPQYLYSYLFRKARTTGSCTVTQERLSRVLKVVVRTIQSHINDLVRLEYISAKMVDGRCVYTLLLSPKVERLIQRHILDVMPKRNHASLPLKGTPDTTSLAACPASTGVDTPGSCSSGGRRVDSHPPTVPDVSPPRHNTQMLHPQGGDHIARRGDLFAPSSYKEIRDPRDQKSPLSPLGKAAFSSPRCQAVRGEVSPRNKTTEKATPTHLNTASSISAAFERVWSVWPVKKDKLFASRIFTSLARARKLPPIQALLAVIERFKHEDRHWMNGFAPKLTWWLKGQCWEDEPLLAPASAPVFASSASYGADSFTPQDMPGWMQDPNQIQARLCELRARFGLRG